MIRTSVRGRARIRTGGRATSAHCAHAGQRTVENASGFTLVEVMLVVTVIGILVAVGSPSLMRARGAAYEVSTIGSLKALHSAQISYSTSCAGGYYAPSIPNLATPPTGGGQAFIGPEFKANSTTRQNYTILFTAGTVAAKAPKTCNALAAGQALSTFFVGADLISATNGKVSRYFGVNQHGQIYWSTKRISPFYNGAPPAPATPIS